MNANFDPRVFVFYKPLANGTVVGNIQGDYNNSTSASGKSIVSANVAGEAINDASATAPVRFISSYESLLLQAEAAARGWSTGDDAALYSSAIFINNFTNSLLASASFTSFIKSAAPSNIIM